MAYNGKSSFIPWITCIVFHVMEDCWFVVDNADLPSTVDVNFKMVAISIVPITIHSSTLNLLDNNGA